MEKVVIAVDAGGSKTKVSVVDRSKNILYSVILGSGSPAVVGDHALANIRSGVKQAFESIKSPYTLACIGMGISGLGVITNLEEIRLDFERIYSVPTLIESDASIALYSIVTDLYDKGILVLSGTGSAIFGINQNETVLVGGYGHMLTEVGSAFTTVQELMIQSIRRFESDQIISSLTLKFFNLIGISSVHGFRSFVYNRTKREIASFASFINEEANNGDLEAIELLKKAGRDLAEDVIKTYKILHLDEETVIGFRGGFIMNSPITQDELIKVLKAKNIKFTYVVGDTDPIYGVYYKLKRMNLLC